MIDIYLRMSFLKKNACVSQLCDYILMLYLLEYTSNDYLVNIESIMDNVRWIKD